MFESRVYYYRRIVAVAIGLLYPRPTELVNIWELAMSTWWIPRQTGRQTWKIDDRLPDDTAAAAAAGCFGCCVLYIYFLETSFPRAPGGRLWVRNAPPVPHAFRAYVCLKKIRRDDQTIDDMEALIHTCNIGVSQ